jgi:hypothetical protein
MTETRCSVDRSRNAIGDSGAKALAGSLAGLDALRELNL